MVFLLIFLIITLAILTLKIKFEIKDIKFNSQAKSKINKEYKIIITMYTFYKIPIIKTKITNEKIEKTMNNKKIIKVIKKQELKIIENRKNIDKHIIKELKNIKLEIDEMNLQIFVGTENASATAFIIPIVSTILALMLRNKVSKYNDKQIFSVTPVYINHNLINIEFSGIFKIKMIHIINIICTLSKKRRGDKNERTSNRRSYDYGYE